MDDVTRKVEQLSRVKVLVAAAIPTPRPLDLRQQIEEDHRPMAAGVDHIRRCANACLDRRTDLAAIAPAVRGVSSEHYLADFSRFISASPGNQSVAREGDLPGDLFSERIFVPPR